MKESIKKNKLYIVLACIIFTVLLAFFFIIFALPQMIAHSALEDAIAPFADYGEDDVVELFLPNYREGDYITDVSVIYEESDAMACVQKIVSLAADAKYLDTDTSAAGHWDTSVSVRYEKSIARIYFCQDAFYVADGNTRYVFCVSDGKTQDYAAFIDELEKIIKGAA